VREPSQFSCEIDWLLLVAEDQLWREVSTVAAARAIGDCARLMPAVLAVSINYSRGVWIGLVLGAAGSSLALWVHDE
jgi:hypothetical protein